MDTKKSYKSFLRNYYLWVFFYDFVFAYAIYNALFNLEGLSVFHISLLLAWWSLTSILLEIPSGALADYWSRRNLLAIAPIIKSFCFLTWFFADGNFYLYALGFLFWSIGSTMKSGTSEAFLYDSLVQYDKEKDYEKVVGRKRISFTIAIGVSSLIGGFIAHYSMDATLLFSIVPILLATCFALLLKDTKKQKSTEEVKYLDYIKIALKEVSGNKWLKYFFIYTIGLSIFADLEEFDQLYYVFVSLPIFMFGVMSIIVTSLVSFGNFIAYKLKKVERTLEIITPFVAAILIFFVGFTPSIWTIALLLLGYFVITPIEVLMEGNAQREIKSISRSTVFSVKSLLLNLFGIVVILFFGGITRLSDLPFAYIGISVVLFMFGVYTIYKRASLSNQDSIQPTKSGT